MEIKKKIKNLDKASILNSMDSYVRKSISDEGAHEFWLMMGVPDDADAEDLKEIAEDHEDFAHCCEVFAKIIRKYDK